MRQTCRVIDGWPAEMRRPLLELVRKKQIVMSACVLYNAY